MRKVSKSLSTVRNFRIVNDWLWRGGQPSAQALAELSQSGVRTILSLRAGRRTAVAEREVAESLGMNFIQLPVYYLNLPDDEMIERLLGVLDDLENHPVYVHCFHGVDRTGLLIAAYRIARMEWAVEDAYEEMKQCGFHTLRLPHFKWMLWSYARRTWKRSEPGNNHSDFSVKRS